MNGDALIEALNLPPGSRVDQRVPKKLLLENGAPTATDKRIISDGIEELLWLAALKPTTIGVPEYRNEVREYLEIAVLGLTLRDGAKVERLRELIHRAIPYPVFLIRSQPDGLVLSLAHLRWSHGQSGQTVLDGSLVTAVVDGDTPQTNAFLSSLNVNSQPREHIHAFYQGWVERFEAYAAARFTGSFALVPDAAAAGRRRAALAEFEHLTREIAGLRARASRETQLNRRVELNLKLRELESRVAETANHF
jgi:Domain of unknown function (DUF4391)